MFHSFESVNYRIFFLYSSVISAAGYSYQVTIDWLILDMTGSAKVLGILGGVQIVPYIFLSPVAGHAADRFNKHTILMIASSLNMIMAALFYLLYHFDILNLYALAIMMFTWGSINAVEGSIRTTFSVELVSPELRTNAVSLNSITFNVGRLFGPIAAGVIIVNINNGAPFIFICVVNFTLLFILRKIKYTLIESNSDDLAPKFRETLAYLMRNQILFFPMFFSSLLFGLGMNFSMFSSLIVKSEFSLDATFLGALNLIIALGSILGAASAARSAGFGQLPTLSRIFKSGVLLGLLWSLSAFMPGFWSFASIAALMAFMHLVLMATVNSFVVITAPSGYLNRIYGIFLTIFWVGAALGTPLMGYLTEILGVRGAILTGGVTTTLISLLFFIKK